MVGEPWFADPSSIIGKDQEFFKGWAEGVFYECDYKGQSKIFTHYQLEEFLENLKLKLNRLRHTDCFGIRILCHNKILVF